MIQAPRPPGPHYSVQLAPRVPVGTRLPRAEQSAAAEGLLRALRAHASISSGWSSKSHARAMAAAVLSDAGGVGIDVEYDAPGRKICAIVEYLMHAPPADEAAAYRTFTFYEAYFKAVGDFPTPELLRLAARATEPRYSTPDGWSVLHEAPAESFFLTLVWRGGGPPVRHDFPEQAERRL